jgi:hypothetical protein
MTKTKPAVPGGGGNTQAVSARLAVDGEAVPGGERKRLHRGVDGRRVLTTMLSFYLEIAEWADDDPARRAALAVRCPGSASEASRCRSNRRLGLHR